MAMYIYAAFFFTAFVVCSLLNLAGQFHGMRKISRGTKSFLMPTLMLSADAVLLAGGAPSWTVLLLTTALCAHTAGDILLLFPGNTFFLAGLSAFLFGHIFYIAMFCPAFASMNILFFIISYGILVLLIIFLLTKIKKQGFFMCMAVCVYALILGSACISGLACTLRNFSVWTLLLPLGTATFILSDSMIAYSKFKCRFKHSDFWVMLTYIVAQTVIALGVLGMNGCL